jgi:hypothetical protein
LGEFFDCGELAAKGLSHAPWRAALDGGATGQRLLLDEDASVRLAYEDFSPEQFEDVVLALCHDLLGAGVQGFTKGPDGGRDAKFTGTAQELPSKVGPWRGTVVIQAKHTNGLNKRFTDGDFFAKDAEKRKSTTLGEEIPKIKRLVDKGELDHYMLFSNRRLTGEGQSEIQQTIVDECGLPTESVCLVGVEQMERWLKAYPSAMRRVTINPLESPMIVSPDELADVVESLAKQLDMIDLDIAPVDRVAYEEKNRRNNMSSDYAKTLRRYYLRDSQLVREFLADPINKEVLGWYNSAAEEFQLKIVAKREKFNAFDDMLNYLWDLLFSRDPLLRANKRLTRVVVFYMYWNCDIGDDGDRAAGDAGAETVA